jgi:hypothetical protein
MDNFVTFLETVALRRWGQSVEEKPAAVVLPVEAPEDPDADLQDQVAVWNTLLELYLTLGEEEGVLRAKALRVLGSETIPYNDTHALILCSSRGYTKGLVLLWEKMGMHDDVIRFWMDQHKVGSMAGASEQVVHYLEAYGPKRPHFYPMVLRFLTSSEELLSKHKEDVKKVVRHIDDEGIIPPLGIVQALSWNGVASVGLVKEWLLEKIIESREEIRVVSSHSFIYSGGIILSGLDRTESLHIRIGWRRTPSYSRSSSCRIPNIQKYSTSPAVRSDLPSIHFMCDHSYHARYAHFHHCSIYADAPLRVSLTMRGWRTNMSSFCLRCRTACLRLLLRL